MCYKKKQKKAERAGVKDSLGSQLTPTHGMPAEFVPNRSSECEELAAY